MGADEIKVKCAECDKPAVWLYPTSGGSTDEDFFCDDCVSRGCSCNYDEETGEVEKDDQGRELPCVNYIYSEEGFTENDDD